jgi:hypothetical protein
VRILLGENADEHFQYAHWKPPRPGADPLLQRLLADYPAAVCRALLDFYFPDGGDKLPAKRKSWKEAFGHIYAAVQIHASQRGFVDGLVRGGAGHLVHRYRNEFRAKSADRVYPKAHGATHGADNLLWWFGEPYGLTENEKTIVREALLEDFAKFIRGEEIDLGNADKHEVRRLDGQGQSSIWIDSHWDDGIKTWSAIERAMAGSMGRQAKL